VSLALVQVWVSTCSHLFFCFSGLIRSSLISYSQYHLFGRRERLAESGSHTAVPYNNHSTKASVTAMRDCQDRGVKATKVPQAPPQSSTPWACRIHCLTSMMLWEDCGWWERSEQAGTETALSLLEIRTGGLETLVTTSPHSSIQQSTTRFNL